MDTASKERIAEDGMKVNDIIVENQDLDSYSPPCMYKKNNNCKILCQSLNGLH